MAYFPDVIPGPVPTIDDREFWNFCNARELRFQCCDMCGHFRHPPGPACPRCQSFRSHWAPASADPELFSFTVVYFKAHPDVASRLPYNVAIVHFPLCSDVRVVSNVVEIDNDELEIGMRLSLVWERSGNGMLLPRFKKKC